MYRMPIWGLTAHDRQRTMGVPHDERGSNYVTSTRNESPERPPRQRPPRTVRQRLLRPRTIFLLLLLLAAAVVVGGYFTPTRRWVYATGHIMPRQAITIRSSVAGVIEKFLVGSGELVEPNQLLIQLRNDLQRAAFDELESQLKAKAAELLQLTKTQELELAQRAAQIERAGLNLKLAQHYLERLKKAGTETVSEVAIEEAELQADLASNRLKELRLPHKPLMEQQIVVLQERIAASRKKRPLLEAELKLRQIRAPVRGTVHFHGFVVGEVVGVDHELGQVFDRDGWIARLQLSEREIPFVSKDQRVRLGLSAYQPVRHGYLEGKILSVNKVVTPRATGDAIFYTEAGVITREGIELHPGMSAWGYVDTGETTWLHRMTGW